ncbi:ABC transporter ATP-binding protein [bacterium]|nr:ABC transporter ATP-binding protein [bacterium]MBP9811152.1 ABC transporter ATP-binding protein [bacterium]
MAKLEIASPQVVIEATNLTKDRLSSFLKKRTRVLDSVSLRVEAGQTYGLIGPNGAGKTTTVKLLLGLLHPDSGQASVLGSPASARDKLAQIGFLPENPYFYSHLTGREFLTFVGKLFSMPDALIKERVKLLVEKVSLENACDRATGKYSKGMLQRLGIAQALINDPQVLFLDEPMSGLDPLGRMDVRRILHELKAEGKTIFFNSHLLPDVGELCDRVGLLVQGKMVADAPVSEIAPDGNFKALEDFFLEHVKIESDKTKAEQAKAALSYQTNLESKP